MSALISFIKGIATGVTSIVSFLLTMIEDVAYVVTLTAKFVTQIPDYLSFMPPAVLALVVSMFAVVVIYKILGRE